LTACRQNSHRNTARLLALLLAAALPAACVAPSPPADPFAGAWTTGEHQQIAFRDNTVVISAAGEAPTPMSGATCDGHFRFGYGTWSREVLVSLAAPQPTLRHQLETQLAQPQYRVASVACGEGGTTYVLLDDHDLLAIHRDRDIAGVEHLTRL
jgi:hypothetical protein